MAAVVTQRSEWYVDSSTSTPVILKGKVGIDYYLVRVKTASANVSIRHLVDFEADDLTEVDITADNGVVSGIVPDTTFNRRQLEIDNSAKWTYAQTFASGTLIDVAIPINNLYVSAVWEASSGNYTPVEGLETKNGKVHVQAASGRVIGKGLCIVTDGTGDQVIPMILYATATTRVVAAA
jgi:hypothetical protein